MGFPAVGTPVTTVVVSGAVAVSVTGMCCTGTDLSGAHACVRTSSLCVHGSGG